MVLDDVVSGGSTADGVLSRREAEGISVLALVAIVLRDHGFDRLAAKHGLPAHGLVRLDDGSIRLA